MGYLMVRGYVMVVLSAISVWSAIVAESAGLH